VKVFHRLGPSDILRLLISQWDHSGPAVLPWRESESSVLASPSLSWARSHIPDRDLARIHRASRAVGLGEISMENPLGLTNAQRLSASCSENSVWCKWFF
jgi:hypothetical protein